MKRKAQEMNREFLEALEIQTKKTTGIAVVGGGGKTSLLFRLTEEFLRMDKRVIVTTTTHMAYEPERPFARDGEELLVKKHLMEQGYTMAAAWDGCSEKVSGLSEEKLEALFPMCDVLLIEADGAKRLPVKVPRSWEPVIPECADLVIAVVGLDCLGKAIVETAHRPTDVAAFLEKKPEALLMPEDVLSLVTSERGLKKGVDHREYVIYLNKAELAPEEAVSMTAELHRRGYRAAFGSLKEGWAEKGEGR